MSDDEESLLDPSDPETQFVPQEDDDETLWEVIEITAEKAKEYKVRWKGVDPKTQRPWPQSWVAKHDCTDDLVRDWKLRLAKKKKASTRNSKKSRALSATVKSTGSGSTSKTRASPSKFEFTRRSTSTATATTTRRGRSRAATSSTGPNKTPGPVLPPRKKRKLEVEVVNYYAHSTSSAEVDDEGRKRKIRRRVIPSDDDDDDVEVKLESDVAVELGPKHSKLHRRNKSLSAEEEEDERMVQESLPDVYSPPRMSPQDSSCDQEEGTPTLLAQAPGPAYTRQDTTEESSPTVSQPQRETESHSLSGRSTTPIPLPIPRSMEVSLPGPSAAPSAVPTTPPRNKDSGDNGKGYSHKSPILSPRAHKRLRLFDQALMRIDLVMKETEKEQRLSTAQKSREREKKDEEMAVARGSGRPEHGFVRTSEDKNRKRMEKDETGDDKAQDASIPKPLEIQKQKKVEALFLPDESDFEDRAIRRPATLRSNSFVNDIIPESEESQSRSQGTDLQVPTTPHLPVPPTTPSSKLTLKSRMRPQPKSRPLSRSSPAVGALALGVKLNMDMGVDNNVHDNLNDELDGVDEAVKKTSKKKANNENRATSKPFGPIPRISPSAFTAHLPSSLPESIIESTEGDGDAAAKRITDRNEEDDSIEQFESPKKDMGSTLGGERRIGVLNAASRQERGKQQTKESASDIWNSDLTRRGQEMAEAARRREKERLRADVKSALPASTLTKDNDIDMNMEMGTSIVEQRLDPMHLRQEEEESSQDVMTELLRQQQQGNGVGQRAINDTGDLLPAVQIDSQPISEALSDKDSQKRTNTGNEKSNRFLDEIPSIIVENPSRASLPRSYSSLEDGDGVSRRKAKSRSRSRSVSSQKSKNDKEPDPEAEIPATASTHRESLQALSQPADSQTESAENPHHLGAAMHLLNIKSEEISQLEHQVSAEQRRNEDLLQQLSAFQLANKASSATKTLEQELAEARAQLALQTASWEKERAALVLDIETATRGKVSAEQDRDFFREQYTRASGFVSSVRDENVELEKQIKIATDQTQSGVSLIKTTFELRTKSLEEDVRAWRRMAEFLIEKDRRTNDDIRKRAAQEPELRARCDRQEGALEQMDMELEEKQRMLSEAEAAGKRWQEATVKLNVELNEVKTKLERIGKVGIGEDEESAHPNGHEFVYRCQWRPDNSNDTCEAVFLNISELQEHLYTGGHLQPTNEI